MARANTLKSPPRNFALLYATLSNEECAHRLGVTPAAVRYRARTLGLPPKRQGMSTTERPIPEGFAAAFRRHGPSGTARLYAVSPVQVVLWWAALTWRPDTVIDADTIPDDPTDAPVVPRKKGPIFGPDGEWPGMSLDLYRLAMAWPAPARWSDEELEAAYL